MIYTLTDKFSMKNKSTTWPLFYSIWICKSNVLWS